MMASSMQRRKALHPGCNRATDKGRKAKMRLLAILTTAVALMAAVPANAANNGNHYGWTNGVGNPHGAPGPLLAGGLPVIAALGGVYWLVRRKRR
jgi:hypothetical protein